MGSILLAAELNSSGLELLNKKYKAGQKQDFK